MTIYYLYIKTHNLTGLKYLGQTSQNPYIYSGSGVDWNRHLREYGKDISTEILFESTDKAQVNELGRFYSKEWNIVDSPAWANRIPETGGGIGRSYIPDEERKRTSIRQSGKNNVACRPDFAEKHSGNNHWMNRPEHKGFTHIMTRPEVRERVSGRNSIRYNSTVYSFKNTVTGEIVNMTMYDFRKTYSLQQSSVSKLVSGVYKKCQSWIIYQDN